MQKSVSKLKSLRASAVWKSIVCSSLFAVMGSAGAEVITWSPNSDTQYSVSQGVYFTEKPNYQWGVNYKSDQYSTGTPSRWLSIHRTNVTPNCGTFTMEVIPIGVEVIHIESGANVSANALAGASATIRFHDSGNTMVIPEFYNTTAGTPPEGGVGARASQSRTVNYCSDVQNQKDPYFPWISQEAVYKNMFLETKTYFKPVQYKMLTSCDQTYRVKTGISVILTDTSSSNGLIWRHQGGPHKKIVFLVQDNGTIRGGNCSSGGGGSGGGGGGGTTPNPPQPPTPTPTCTITGGGNKSISMLDTKVEDIRQNRQTYGQQFDLSFSCPSNAQFDMSFVDANRPGYNQNHLYVQQGNGAAKGVMLALYAKEGSNYTGTDMVYFNGQKHLTSSKSWMASTKKISMQVDYVQVPNVTVTPGNVVAATTYTVTYK